ncbi:MAG: ATP-grasp domain-containing protein [Ilumatobacteraceae bacterium]
MVFVLGKRPRPGTVIAAALDELRADGCDTSVLLPHDDSSPSPAWWAGADLVVQRGLRPNALISLLAVEAVGIRCCNGVAATLQVADRLGVADRLTAAGLPVPTTQPAEDWADVRARVGGGAVVKSRDGSAGRGVGVRVVDHGVLSSVPAPDGPWVVQDLVQHDGFIRKLYVVGREVRALLKRAADGHDDASVRSLDDVPSHLGELAVQAGAALRLDVLGVDVLVDHAGPWVVDVNPFPGLRGVHDAAALLTALLLTLAEDERADRSQPLP